MPVHMQVLRLKGRHQSRVYSPGAPGYGTQASTPPAPIEPATGACRWIAHGSPETQIVRNTASVRRACWVLNASSSNQHIFDSYWDDRHSIDDMAAWVLPRRCPSTRDLDAFDPIDHMA